MYNFILIIDSLPWIARTATTTITFRVLDNNLSGQNAKQLNDNGIKEKIIIVIYDCDLEIKYLN